MPNKWEFFSEGELKCSGCGKAFMDDGFMKQLVELRRTYGKPMIITSGYRDADYNRKIGGAPNSAHLYGKAVDVRVMGQDAYTLLKMALAMGFTGIGVKQHGPVENRFLHLDTINTQDNIVRPIVWSYA